MTTDQHELQHVADAHGEHSSVAVRHERPEDWGWHADLHRPARIAGLVSAILLILLAFATVDSGAEKIWSATVGGYMLLWLAFDAVRRMRAGRRR